MSRIFRRAIAPALALALIAGACGDDDGGGTDDPGEAPTDLDYAALGLWDDGACDEALEPLHLGLMTTFESPFVSLGDQADALEAAAEAFNARGGANGACIEVTTCDDGASIDGAIECARTFVDAGVHATVNDQITAGHLEVSEAMAEAGIPRVAANVINTDWTDPNAYPLDAAGTGTAFLSPQALIDADVTEIGVVRVDNASAGALLGLLNQVYEGDATFPLDVGVPAGTTDFSQFILSAESEGVGGITLLLGEQEAIQIVRAGESLGTELLIGASLGSFPHSIVAELGDFAEQMVFLWSFAPATADIPVYEALRADLAASGEDSLQLENLKASPMRSWIGLYALLYMLREAGTTEFSGPAITEVLQASGPVPMLDMFGGEDWEPNLDHPGAYTRAGIDRWATYRWDPEAEAPGGLEGNWVEASTISFDAVMCGSVLGAPEPC
jgi:ABC-type branched-subunit amino acid transport system substrate-binding protein